MNLALGLSQEQELNQILRYILENGQLQLFFWSYIKISKSKICLSYDFGIFMITFFFLAYFLISSLPSPSWFLGLVTTALSTSLNGGTHYFHVVLLAGTIYSGINPFTPRKDRNGMSQLDGTLKGECFEESKS